MAVGVHINLEDVSIFIVFQPLALIKQQIIKERPISQEKLIGRFRFLYWDIVPLKVTELLQYK